MRIPSIGINLNSSNTFLNIPRQNIGRTCFSQGLKHDTFIPGFKGNEETGTRTEEVAPGVEIIHFPPVSHEDAKQEEGSRLGGERGDSGIRDPLDSSLPDDF